MTLQRVGKFCLILLALACVAYTLRHSAKDFLALPRPNLSLLALAGLLFLVHYVIQAFGWHGINRSLGQRMPVSVSFRMWYMSLIARWMPGRVWYSATRLLLAKEAGLSLTAVTFAIVLELIYIMVGGILATVLFIGRTISGLLTSAGGTYTLAAASLIIFIAGALAIRPAFLVQMGRFAFFRKAVRKLAGEELTDQNMPSMSVGRSLCLLAYYTVFWIYSGVMFGVLASAFIPMDSGRWLACISAFPGSWLIGFFSIITPAGLGAREGALWLMLKPVMPQAQAVVLAISSRLMMVAAELLSVGIAFVLLGGAARSVNMASKAVPLPVAAVEVPRRRWRRMNGERVTLIEEARPVKTEAVESENLPGRNLDGLEAARGGQLA